MNWQEVVAITVVLVGLGAGAFLVAQRSSVWNEFGQKLGRALLPLAWRYVSNRMSPEEEAAWRQAERRGQGDEWVTERRRRGHFSDGDHTCRHAVDRTRSASQTKKNTYCYKSFACLVFRANGMTSSFKKVTSRGTRHSESPSSI